MKDTSGARNADLAGCVPRRTRGCRYLKCGGYNEAKAAPTAFLPTWSSGISHLLSVAAQVRFPQGASIAIDPERRNLLMRPTRNRSPLCVSDSFSEHSLCGVILPIAISNENGEPTFAESIDLPAKVSYRRYEIDGHRGYAAPDSSTGGQGWVHWSIA
jgi:hypothetical protein